MRFKNEGENHIEEYDPSRGLPYRGSISHMPNTPPVVFERVADPKEGESLFEPGEEVVYELPELPEPDETPEFKIPIPVEVLSMPTKQEYKTVSLVTQPVESNPRRIVPRQTNRTKLTIVNTGDMSVWIKSDVTVSPSNGFELLAGYTLELSSQSDIYAVVDNGYSTVSIADESISSIVDL